VHLLACTDLENLGANVYWFKRHHVDNRRALPELLGEFRGVRLNDQNHKDVFGVAECDHWEEMVLLDGDRNSAIP
jgi:hypothetical protein